VAALAAVQQERRAVLGRVSHRGVSCRCRVAKPTERFGFELPGSFPCDAGHATNLLEAHAVAVLFGKIERV
jgi:hypothetical protein